MDVSLYELGLAILLHDPPWKPWGMLVELEGGARIQLDGCRSGEALWMCIARALESEGPKEGMTKKAVECVKGFVDEIEGLRRGEELRCAGGQGRLKSHEAQGAVALAAIACELEEKGLSMAAAAARNAAILILSCDSKIAEADRLASAVDRLLMPRLEVRIPRFKFVNPLNPSLTLDLDVKLSSGLVARFIARLAVRTAKALSGKDDPGLLFHVVYSLMEPTWFETVGRLSPADTRIPTHTVFDHVNAALAAMLWTLEGGRPRGCVAVFDLAGVQGWIEESKRLRDLWAASWLASLLAWKTVEGFVERLGPGALIQPPARLNPLYASWLLGSKLGLKPDDNDGREFFKLLGLREGWPIDPSVPSRVALALPPEECRDFERKAMEEYEKTWKTIISYVADAVKEICRGDVNLEAVPACEALNEMKELEPPLPARLFKVMLDDSFTEAGRLYHKVEGLKRAGLTREEAERALFYPIIVLKLLPLREKEVELRLGGRFTGPKYYEYAAKIYSKVKVPGICVVCGRGVAALDGKKLGGQAKATIIARELFEDRLCPYCLAKRLLRHLLEHKGLSQRLLGMPVPGSVREKLHRGTVDSYTSRTVIEYDKLKSYVEDIARRLAGNSSVRNMFMVQARNRFLKNGDRSRIIDDIKDREAVEYAESMVLEAAHSEGYIRKVEESIRSMSGSMPSNLVQQALNIVDTLRRLNREVSRVKRRYAIIRLDGDFMGRGVLPGVLPWRRGWYLERVLNLPSDVRGSVEARVSAALDAINKVRREALKALEPKEPSGGAGGVCGCPRLGELEVVVLPTLSYHFTVSRALMAQALLDRATIEKYNGHVVFAGGDDLLAILPPAERDPAGLAKPTSLDAAAELRRKYWGAFDTITAGFNVVKVGGTVIAVVPALAVYGRSGSLVYVDSIHPIWGSLRLAGELEESKDFAMLAGSDEDCQSSWEKDVLFLVGESGGIAVLPQSFGPPENRDAVLRAAGSVYAAAFMARAGGRAIGAAGTPISGTLAYDAQEYVGLLAEVSRKSPEAGLDVLKRMLERNLDGRRVNLLGVKGCSPRNHSGCVDAIIHHLAKTSGLDDEAGLLKLAVVVGGGMAEALMRSSGLSEELHECQAQRLAVALIASVKAFREAV